MQDIAYVLATGYVGLSILLSGFFVRPSQLKIAPLLWLSYISYPRWAMLCAATLSSSFSPKLFGKRLLMLGFLVWQCFHVSLAGGFKGTEHGFQF